MEQAGNVLEEQNEFPSNNSTSYNFDKEKRVYIVESSYKSEGCETIDSILLRLMKADSEKH